MSMSRAIRNWQQFKDETHHELSARGFRQAWRQMFGSTAPEKYVQQWLTGAEKLRKAAGAYRDTVLP